MARTAFSLFQQAQEQTKTHLGHNIQSASQTADNELEQCLIVYWQSSSNSIGFDPIVDF